MKKILKYKQSILLTVLIVLANVVTFLSYHTPIKASRVTCPSFRTQAEAQKIFISDPVKYKSLDSNKDGKACQNLK